MRLLQRAELFVLLIVVWCTLGMRAFAYTTASLRMRTAYVFGILRDHYLTFDEQLNRFNGYMETSISVWDILGVGATTTTILGSIFYFGRKILDWTDGGEVIVDQTVEGDSTPTQSDREGDGTKEPTQTETQLTELQTTVNKLGEMMIDMAEHRQTDLTEQRVTLQEMEKKFNSTLDAIIRTQTLNTEAQLLHTSTVLKRI